MYVLDPQQYVCNSRIGAKLHPPYNLQLMKTNLATRLSHRGHMTLGSTRPE